MPSMPTPVCCVVFFANFANFPLLLSSICEEGIVSSSFSSSGFSIDLKMVKQLIHRGSHASESSSSGVNEDSNFVSRGRMRNSLPQRRRGGPLMGPDRKKHKSKIEAIIDVEDDSDDNEVKWRATILSWLISSKTLEENARVCYIERSDKPPVKEGIIKREGILCNCCGKIFTVGDFQVHAVNKILNPYERIFIWGTNVSLFSCMIEAWEKPEESRLHRFNYIQNSESVGDSYDDACIICADGGNLMCCESCTSTYHHACLNMQEVPEGKWYCPYCACKFCGRPSDENDYLLTCALCEKKYHWACYRKRQMNQRIAIDVNSIPPPPFCVRSCQEAYEILEQNIGVRNELPDGYTWSLLQRIDEYSDSSNVDLYRRVECRSKLAVAWRTMNSCFEPIIDRHTKVDMIRSVVYNCGSNFNRVNFRTFYTAVLEKNDEMISVASLRFRGSKIAEMPFVATSENHRNKGMCSRLMTAIESALRSLRVENLVIPSTPEMVVSWRRRYGFTSLDRELQNEMVLVNTLMFHDSVRLRKHFPLAVNEMDKGNNEDRDGQMFGPVQFLLDLNHEPE